VEFWNTDACEKAATLNGKNKSTTLSVNHLDWNAFRCLSLFNDRVYIPFEMSLNIELNLLLDNVGKLYYK
jgi:hypothetical protein